MIQPLPPIISKEIGLHHECCMETKADKEPALTIAALRPEQEDQWRWLWEQYLDFYEVGLAEDVTAHAWRNILVNQNVLGLGASRSSDLIGFAIVILHEATWSVRRNAYLEDLFVCGDERGRGIGRRIIDQLIDRARANEWGTVYWHTQASNTGARALYDSYCLADDFVRYRLTI
jgi:GNAT superfamily N-acetyltransferase